MSSYRKFASPERAPFITAHGKQRLALSNRITANLSGPSGSDKRLNYFSTPISSGGPARVPISS